MQLQLMDRQIVYPFNSPEFMEVWKLWKDYKREQFKFTYKTIGEQSTLKALGEDSGNNEAIAIQMIHRAIASGYRGIFPIKGIVKQSTEDTIFKQLSERYK
jgi:hypothetical protein